MTTIVFTNQKEYSYDLVEHYNALGVYSFHHYLINHRIIKLIKSDIDLFKDLSTELVVVVYYLNNELLEYAKRELGEEYELEVV